MPHHDSKHRIEEYLKLSGLRATMVRPTAFMENFATVMAPSLEDGTIVLRLPLPDDIALKMHPEPIGELRHIYDWYKPLAANYAGFGVDPEAWAWALDSWKALEQIGADLISPASGLWTAEVIEKRLEQIRRAPTTSAGKGGAS